MKDIRIEKTKIKLSTVKFTKPEDDIEMDYKDLLEYCLDVVPQGGFTPSDIRERNRIQKSLDSVQKKVGKDGKETNVLKLEDSDYENLSKIVKTSRWTIRNKELSEFFDSFETK